MPRPRFRFVCFLLGVLACWSVRAGAAELDYPLSIAVTNSGVIYLADRNLPGVWKLEGEKLTLFFEGSRKFRTPLNAIRCLAIDQEGKLLAGDSSTRDVYRFDDAGKPVGLTQNQKPASAEAGPVAAPPPATQPEGKNPTAKKDEAKKDEAKKQDDSKKDDATKDDVKKDELKKDESKKDNDPAAGGKKEEKKGDAVKSDGGADKPAAPALLRRPGRSSYSARLGFPWTSPSTKPGTCSCPIWRSIVL